MDEIFYPWVILFHEWDATDTGSALALAVLG